MSGATVSHVAKLERRSKAWAGVSAAILSLELFGCTVDRIICARRRRYRYIQGAQRLETRDAA